MTYLQLFIPGVDGVVPVSATNPLPVSGGAGGGGTGDASAAKQDVSNALLTMIEADTTATANSLGSIDTKLSSQATAANQTATNASLTSVDTKLTSQATAANQTSTNSSLSAIDTKLVSQATAANQATQIASLTAGIRARRRDADTTEATLTGESHQVYTDAFGRLKTVGQASEFPAVVGDITTAVGVVQASIGRASNILIFCTGVFAGVNVTFEGSLDNVNWFGVQAARTNANTVESTSGLLSATPAYAWELSVNAISFFRVRATAWTSGTQSWRFQPGAYATEPIPAIQSHPVTITSGTTTITPNAAVLTTYALEAAATTNLVLINAGARTVYELVAFNGTAATIFVKFYNKASAPVVATDTPLFTIPVAAGAFVSFNFGFSGKRFTLGIALAITGAAVKTDATAIAVGPQISLTSS